jgi:cobalt-precorrin 5A hydrolase
MKKRAICFTRQGRDLIERLIETCRTKRILPPEGYMLSGTADPGSLKKVRTSLREWMEEAFRDKNAILFVGAAGIAVRAISGLPEDKLKDAPLLVLDDGGRYVIPILSGHAGGGNKLAVTVAELLHAEAVITTSSDVNGAFPADVFAVENRLTIRNRAGIKKVSAKAIEGRSITLSIKNYPPKEPVDLIVADETDAEYSLLLSPREYTVGLGMKKNTKAEDLEKFFLEMLADHGLQPDDVYALCTIDLKMDEPALRGICDRYAIPLLAFDAELLRKAEGIFHASGFVLRTVGVDNVCERAAVLGAGPGAKLIVPKSAGNGMTAAVARRRR